MKCRIQHNGLTTPTIYSEKEAMNLRDRMQPYFSKPLVLVPVETEDEPPRLQVIEGGRK